MKKISAQFLPMYISRTLLINTAVLLMLGGAELMCDNFIVIFALVVLPL